MCSSFLPQHAMLHLEINSFLLLLRAVSCILIGTDLVWQSLSHLLFFFFAYWHKAPQKLDIKLISRMKPLKSSKH